MQCACDTDRWSVDITLKELGLEVVYPVEDLFWKLLGNTIVLVLCVFQLQAFISERTQEAAEAAPVDSTWLNTLLQFTKRFLYLHAPKLTATVIWFVILSKELNVFGLVNLVLLVISLFFSRGTDSLGALLLAYNQVCILLDS